MKKNLDVTKPRYSEEISPVPGPVVLSEVVSEIPLYLIMLSDYLRIVFLLYCIDFIVWYTYFALYGSLGKNGM